jgi:hypothetical protein
MPRLLACAVLFTILARHALADAPATRPVVVFTDAMLANLRANCASDHEPFRTCWANLQADARKALTGTYPPYVGANSVEFAGAARRTGGAVRDLLLVHAVTGDAALAQRARAILLDWATHDPLPGSTLDRQPYVSGQDRGDSVAGLGLNVGLAACILANDYSLLYPYLTEQERAACEKWLRLLGDVTREGHQVWIDKNYFSHQDFNNHLTGHLMGLAAVGYAVGDDALVHYALDSPENPRDLVEMLDGTIIMGRDQLYPADPTITKGAPEPEVGEIYDRYRVLTIRNNLGCGLAYAFFHLKMLATTAEMAFHHGTDYFARTGPRSQSLRLPFEVHAKYLITGRADTAPGYFQDNVLHLSDAHIYELAAAHYPTSASIAQVLARCNRVTNDLPLYGWSAPLLYGR